MPIIELNFPAYTVMPRIVCSEVPKKKFIVLNMRRLKFDDGPHLPRHFRSSLTRVTHNIGLLGKPTVQILIFTPVLTRFLYKAVLIQESGIRVCNPQPLLFFENFLLEYSVRLHFVSVSEIPVQIDAEMILCEGVEERGFFQWLLF